MNSLPTFSHEDMVANILSVWSVADEVARRDGAEWYPAMFRIMREHATVSGYTVAQCAAVYAANSINTPWARNIALASAAIADRGMTGGTLGMIVRKVNAILAGGDLDSALTSDPNNLKIVSFRRNLSGDYQTVTVDRWAHRIATNGARSDVPSGNYYRAVAAAYIEAARIANVEPATMQAVTWVVARGSAE